ncbi:hypothetical protein COY23_03270 [bacterium (Candidatus Torokbacteria) CG_4_10_14_0_2_um_filter_35_8]|nr:MAG: hypothetical protein COY23_03270 [bacterium (Candidatus Torokbacteria) CG_4_10_14_0_2_um_filter_35_8]
MRSLLKRILQSILRGYSKRILSRKKPTIIAITGSIGKTSTKEAIFCVLKGKFSVRKSTKNYNNEIGLPLTILGEESGGGSFLEWFSILGRGFKTSFLKLKKYPDILILEMGADRPGDLRYLTSFIPIKVAVVTSVGPTHLEFFDTLENIADEKEVIVRRIPEDGAAVLNFDNIWVRNMMGVSKGQVFGFGIRSDKAEIKAENISVDYQNPALEFDFSYKNKKAYIRLDKMISKHQVYAVLAAASCGIYFGMSLEEVVKSLENFSGPAGRMKIIEGIKDALIIDDTYNAAPESVLKALNALKGFKGRRKVAVLGDMLELGPYSKKGHKEVGRKVAEVCDLLITSGTLAKLISKSAKSHGMDSNKIMEFENSDEARIPTQNKIRKGDVILVKGSQGARMEKIVKEIMRYPEKARRLLVRQGSEWE